MKLTSLENLLVSELQDLYSAETQIIKALPKMVEAANSPELRECFEEHLEQTREQVTRLDKIFKTMGHTAKGKKCKGMEGLLEEGGELLKERDADENVLDAGLIAAAQRVEHYEMAAYGSARTFAELLGQDEAVTLLEETLEEEKQADQKLTEIATSVVNLKASEETEESNEENLQERDLPSKSKRQGAGRRS